MSISKKRIKELQSIKDNEIDYSDIPKLDESFFKRAKLEFPEKKKAISLRLDSDILAWFKSQGGGYQTLINAILKAYVKTVKKN